MVKEIDLDNELLKWESIYNGYVKGKSVKGLDLFMVRLWIERDEWNKVLMLICEGKENRYYVIGLKKGIELLCNEV